MAADFPIKSHRKLIEVAKLVDALDSKSSNGNTISGAIPGFGIIQLIQNLSIILPIANNFAGEGPPRSIPP
jgi:hypothetical protein